MATKRIAILGSGANGASIGADLTEAGLDVVLIDQWPAHVEAMRANGVRIEMPERTQEVAVDARHLCEVAEMRERFDLVLILVKAYDTRWACHLIAPLVAPDGLVAGVQNGMTAGVVAEVFGPERAIGAVIEISSEMTEPGIVHRHSGPANSYFAVGPVAGAASDRAAEVAAVLAHSATTVEVSPQIEAAKWIKLVSNSSTLVPSAILGAPIAAAAKLEPMRGLMLSAGREALAAGAARGYPPLPIFGLDQAQLDAASDQLPELLLDTLVDRYVLPETTSTVLHDWRKGRRAEVAAINGEVVATLGAAAAPVNAAIVELAGRVERGELAPGPRNLELLGELAG